LALHVSAAFGHPQSPPAGEIKYLYFRKLTAGSVNSFTEDGKPSSSLQGRDAFGHVYFFWRLKKSKSQTLEKEFNLFKLL